MESDVVRILMVTQWFDPEPACQGLEFTRKLAELGHEVEVLTGFPNYPEGKLYAGYRLGIRREWMAGIRVIRAPLYPSHDKSAMRRTLNYVSFAISATLFGPALVRRPELIYAYHPPGTIGLPALMLGRWFSVPVVYEVQDLWPDTVAASGMLANRMALGLLDKLCRYVYRHADRIVVLSPGFRKALIARGVSADRVSVIYNCAPEQQPGFGRQSPRKDGEFTIVFAGTMGLAQGLDTVLRRRGYAPPPCRRRDSFSWAAAWMRTGCGAKRSGCAWRMWNSGAGSRKPRRRRFWRAQGRCWCI